MIFKYANALLVAGVLLTVFSAMPAKSDPQSDADIKRCMAKKVVADVRQGDVLIVIQRESASRIQPIAIFRNGKILATSDSEYGAGQEIEHFDTLYDLRTGEKHRIDHHLDFDAVVTGCYWFGKFKDPKISVAQRNKAGRWGAGGNLLTIMASQSLPLRFWGAEKESDAFYKALPPGYCATAGDIPEKFTPPCRPPRIYAYSDLNHNGRVEYWYSYATVWDDGFGIAEIVDGKLKPIHEICPGCSD